VFFATMALTLVMAIVIPKGFFPIQDTGMIQGFAEAAQETSPEQMMRLMHTVGDVILSDPDVEGFGSFTGSAGNAQSANTGRYFIVLKPRDDRKLNSSQIIDRLRPQLAKIQSVNLFLQPTQDVNVGARVARGSFQYTLQDTNITELNEWSQKLLDKLRTIPVLADATSDLLANGPRLQITINRDQAARFGISAQAIDDTLNDAFGQRQITQYFTQLKTYFIVLEILPELQQWGRATPDFSSRTVPGRHHHLQSGARRIAWAGRGCRQRRCTRNKYARRRHPDLSGQCAGLPDLAAQRAGADRGRAHRRLHHPRHSL
jgi:multidrug efflux pump subunit AcrB